MNALAARFCSLKIAKSLTACVSAGAAGVLEMMRSKIGRTARIFSCSAAVKSSLDEKRRLSARRRKASGSRGTTCVCCSASICKRCSTRRRNRYVLSNVSTSLVGRRSNSRSARSALSILGSCRNGCRAAWINCSVCTMNSMSRIPPRPSFTSRSRFAVPTMSRSMRCLMCAISSSKSRVVLFG